MDIRKFHKPSEPIKVNDINWRMAFTVEGQFKKERKDDPRYTKFLVRRLSIDNNIGYRNETFLPYHDCTDADYARFYPVNEDSQLNYHAIRTGEKRGFYCIDWEKEELELGVSKGGFTNYVDIMLVPCNYIGKASLGLT